MINAACLPGDGSARKQPESKLVRDEERYEARRMGGVCPKKGSSVGDTCGPTPCRGCHLAEELGIKMVWGPGWKIQGTDFNSTG